jgi:hypothetical protein
VLFVDLDHNGAEAITANLLMFGVPKEVLRNPSRFRHWDKDDARGVESVVADCAQWCPDVVVVDSSGELLPLFDASSDNADEFTRVHNRILQPLATTGAAVLLIDHLAKQQESRRLGPGGSMAKRRTVGGLSMRVVCERPFIKGQGGAARLMVNKDRHGGVREHCAAVGAGSKNTEQLGGTFLLEVGDDGATTWRVAPPTENTTADRPFRPTNLMERASRAVEENPTGHFTKDRLAKEVTGKTQALKRAVDLLFAEEYVTRTEERYPRYTSVKPYRQADDPLSEVQLPLNDRLRRADVHRDDGQDDD